MMSVELKLIVGGVSDEARAKYLTMRRPCTELGNSERLADEHGSRFRHCPELGGWFAYEAGVWSREGGEAGIKQAAKAVVRALGVEAMMLPESDATGRKEMYSHAKKSESNGAINAMIARAQSAPPFASRAAHFDTDPWLFNVKNGTVDLRTGQLRPHDPDDMISKIAPVDFDPAAACPRWLAFLESALPDSDVRSFMQRHAGLTLTGTARERILVVLYGAGKNGKSVYLNVLEALHWSYARRGASDLLVEKAKSGSGAATPGIAALCGARLVLMSETKEGAKLDEATMKRLTGAERISARHLYGPEFSFDMTGKLMLATNHRLKVEEKTPAIWDRIREIPFTVRVDADKVDTSLTEKLCAEMSGVLNWAVAGCLEYQRCGLGTAKAIDAATTAYRAESDDVANFFASTYVADAAGRVPRKHVYDAYVAWAKEAMGKDVGSAAFYATLADLKVGSVKSNGVRFLMVAPKPAITLNASDDD